MSEKAEKIRSELRALEEYIESPAFKTIDGILEQQVNLRRQQILLTPLASADSIYKQEFEKGEAGGIELARGLASALITNLRKDLEKELQNGNGTSNND
jgi:hypothetical protein